MLLATRAGPPRRPDYTLGRGPVRRPVRGPKLRAGPPGSRNPPHEYLMTGGQPTDRSTLTKALEDGRGEPRRATSALDQGAAGGHCFFRPPARGGREWCPPPAAQHADGSGVLGWRCSTMRVAKRSGSAWQPPVSCRCVPGHAPTGSDPGPGIHGHSLTCGGRGEHLASHSCWLPLISRWPHIADAPWQTRHVNREDTYGQPPSHSRGVGCRR